MNKATEADDILAAALLEDAVAHESGSYDRIAEKYDEVYGELLPIQDLGNLFKKRVVGILDSGPELRPVRFHQRPAGFLGKAFRTLVG